MVPRHLFRSSTVAPVRPKWLLAGMAALAVALLVSPAATAAPSADVAQAIAASRGQGSCGALALDPAVDQAAELINQTTYDYVNHIGSNVPIDDASPVAITKDLGIPGEHVMVLRGAAPDTAAAVKVALLQGYLALTDCAYSRVGTSLLTADQVGQVLVTIVMVG